MTAACEHLMGREPCGHPASHRALIGQWVYYVCPDHASPSDLPLDALLSLSPNGPSETERTTHE